MTKLVETFCKTIYFDIDELPDLSEFFFANNVLELTTILIQGDLFLKLDGP